MTALPLSRVFFGGGKQKAEMVTEGNKSGVFFVSGKGMLGKGSCTKGCCL